MSEKPHYNHPKCAHSVQATTTDGPYIVRGCSQCGLVLYRVHRDYEGWPLPTRDAAPLREAGR